MISSKSAIRMRASSEILEGQILAEWRVESLPVVNVRCLWLRETHLRVTGRRLAYVIS